MTTGVGLVLVRMGGRPCAIPADAIVEVVPRVLLRQVPNAPQEVLGVMNLRGRVVTVIDVRARFSDSPDPLPAYQHLVIVDREGQYVGLAVDDVLEVRIVPEDAVERPGDVTGVPGPGVVRIENDLVVVLQPQDVMHARA